MICHKPITEPSTMTKLDRMKGIVCKYEKADNVFIRVEDLALLLWAVELLQDSVNYEMDHGKIAEARLLLEVLSK